MTTAAQGTKTKDEQVGAIMIANGRVAVVTASSAEDGVDLALAIQRWDAGHPGLQRALERKDGPHLSPKLHRFYRTASDALVFVCHIDAEGDAKCHVLAANPMNTFDLEICGANYWVYKSGVVSRNRFTDVTSGGWLMNELPWTLPGLAGAHSQSRSDLESALTSAQKYAGVAVAPGLWKTCNGSVVAVSRHSEVTWGATVALGGHQFNDVPGVSPGTQYKLTNSGAVVWPEADAKGIPKSIRKVAAMSGMALSSRLDVVDSSGAFVEILDWYCPRSLLQRPSNE
ncbi:hypothetical protein ABT392_07835 [Paucibacter sp. JuS9]|uniref:hypothetical protein n=1 Tax=Paucibacter sp. JuS9 TaxID=3228748 RepID=UPI0037571FBB